MPQFPPYTSPVSPRFDVLEALKRRQSPSNFVTQDEGGPRPFIPPSGNAVVSPYESEQRSLRDLVLGANDASQREEVDAIRRAQAGARLRGFDTPQAEAGYGREREEFKAQTPREVAGIQGAADVEASRYKADEALTRLLAQITSREKIAGGNQALREELAERAVPPQTLKELDTARSTYQGNTMPDWFPGNTAQRQDYIAKLANVLRRIGSLEFITAAARDTASSGESVEEALAAAAAQGRTLDPLEVEAFQLFVEELRGP